MNKAALKLLVLLITCGWLLTVSVHAAPVCDLHSLATFEYDVSFNNPTLEYEYKTGAVTHDNGLWLVVGTRERGELGGPQNLWLWKLDATGQKIFEKEFRVLLNSEEHLGRYADIEHMTALKDGGAVIVLGPGGGYSVLVRISAAGKLVAMWPITRQPYEVSIARVLPTPDDHVLAIGNLSGKPLLIKLSLAGEVVWEKVIETLQEKISGFTDGVVSHNGEFLLLGYGGTQKSARLSISKYDGNGELLSEKAFDGDLGTLTMTQDGSYVVAYNRTIPNSLRILLQRYDQALQEVWNTNVHQTTLPRVPPSLPPSVFPIPGGGFLVVTSEGLQLLLIRVNDKGTLEWQCQLPREDGLLRNFALLFSENSFILPITRLTAETIDSAIWQRQSIRVIRFRLPSQ